MRHMDGRARMEQFDPEGQVKSMQIVERFDLGHWEVMEIALALRDRVAGLSDRHGDQTAVRNLAMLFGTEGVFTVTVMRPEA